VLVTVWRCFQTSTGFWSEVDKVLFTCCVTVTTACVALVTARACIHIFRNITVTRVEIHVCVFLRENAGSRARCLPVSLIWIIFGHVSSLMTSGANAKTHEGNCDSNNESSVYCFTRYLYSPRTLFKQRQGCRWYCCYLFIWNMKLYCHQSPMSFVCVVSPLLQRDVGG
jgi:hypothetical protein